VGAFPVKKSLVSRKLRAAVAAISAAAVVASSFSGCSSAIQKQAQSLSSACQSAMSQIESSLGTVSKSISEAVSANVSSLQPSKGKTTATASKTVAKISEKTPAISSRGKADVQSVRKITVGLPASSVPKKSVAAVSVPSARYSKIQQRGDYQHLNSQAEKDLYQLIDRSVYRVALQKSSSGYYPTAQISYPGNISEAQIRVTLLAYMDDNPQVFWLAGVYGYGTQNGRTILQLYSVGSPDECSAAIRRLDSAVSAAIRSVPSGLSEFDREEYLFNYIVGRCSYDNAAVTDTGRWQAFTAYGTLVDGSAVCEGYSRAMQLLAEYVGLNCTLVRGSSNGVGHMWNEIEVGGAWYHLDLTWCDNSIVIYNYYNVTDSIIAQTHTVGPLVSHLSEEQINSETMQYNLDLHACSSTAANYFRYKGIPVTAAGGSGDTAVVKALASRLKESRKSIAFWVRGDYDTTVGGMASGKLTGWLFAAEKLAGKSLDLSNTEYVTDQADNGLTIQVSYR
jgi:transglutaminase-like putative cysteine protease